MAKSGGTCDVLRREQDRSATCSPPRSAPAIAAPATTSSPWSPDDFSIASIAAPEAQQTPIPRAEATAILAELHQLETIGREMAGNRYSGDLMATTITDTAGQRRCMEPMRDARPRLGKIRARTTALPNGAISIGLSASELGVCLVCAKSVDDASMRAKTALRNADGGCHAPDSSRRWPIHP